MQFARLGVNIARQDVVQHDVFDEIGFVKLFVVILFDVLQGHGNQRRITACQIIGTLYKYGVVVTLVRAEHMIGVPIAHKYIPGRQSVGGDAVPHFADSGQLAAGNDGACLIDNTKDTVHRVLHLVDNP